MSYRVTANIKSFTDYKKLMGLPPEVGNAISIQAAIEVALQRSKNT